MTLEQLLKAAEEIAKDCYVYTRAKEGDTVYGYWFEENSSPVKFAFNYRNGLYFMVVNESENQVYIKSNKDVEQKYTINLKEAIPLTKMKTKSYPSLDYLFYYGNKEIEQWLQKNKWEKDWGYNSNFKDSVAEKYNSWWQTTSPFYAHEELFAFEGGWPMTWPDDDEPLLFNNKNEFVVCTLKDPEPWLEFYVTETSGDTGFWRTT